MTPEAVAQAEIRAVGDKDVSGNMSGMEVSAATHSENWVLGEVVGETGGESPVGEEADTEVARGRARKSPKGPTEAERREHEATHLPYRSWCEVCVKL